MSVRGWTAAADGAAVDGRLLAGAVCAGAAVQYGVCYSAIEEESPTRLRLVCEPRERPAFAVLVHASCFKWHPELFFDEEAHRVRGFPSIREKKSQNLCEVCAAPWGCCVECQFHGCQRLFHPECAHRYGIAMTTVKKADRLAREIFCEKHRERRQYETMELNRWRRLNQLRKLFEAAEKATGASVGARERRARRKFAR